MFRFIFVPLVAALAFLSANEQKEEKIETPDMNKVSEALGHLLAKSINGLGINFDLEHLINGIRDCVDGKASPLNETECIQVITAAQENAFKKKSFENLKNAEEFLRKNIEDKKVVSIEDGKLQYKIEKKGSGAEVQAHFSPLIKYVGKYLDGTVFGSSKETEMISLDETILGFSKGLVGMKEGEKRTLYIHPDYGYGTSGYLPPNSLLTFEIELIKANAEPSDSLSATPAKGKAGEVAFPEFDTKAIR